MIRKIKRFKRYLELKIQGYNKEERMRIYALEGLITFDEYDKYLTKKWKKTKVNILGGYKNGR